MGPMLPPSPPHTSCFTSFSPHSCVSSPARHPLSIVHQTTFQSITMTSRKENTIEERRSWTDSTPPPALSSPSAPTSTQPTSSPLSPPAQPSLLASLLARKRSVVTVPASTEASPPTRGSSRPSPDRLPYLPHSPFHLFSYDLDEEPSPPASAKPTEESPKTTSPRSDETPFKMLQSLWRFTLTFSLPTLIVAPAWMAFFTSPSHQSFSVLCHIESAHNPLFLHVSYSVPAAHYRATLIYSSHCVSYCQCRSFRRTASMVAAFTVVFFTLSCCSITSRGVTIQDRKSDTSRSLRLSPSS